MKRIIFYFVMFVTVLVFLTAVPVYTVAQLPVNPQLMNGNFESGGLTGWMTGGTMNYSIQPVTLDGNWVANLEVGYGPIGDECCDKPAYNNFAYLDQLFTVSKNTRIGLDFKVPLPAQLDNTESATCIGFDRVELDFSIADLSGDSYETKLSGVILIDYYAPPGSGLNGHIQLNDFVQDTVISTSFDPSNITQTVLGPITLKQSATLPGWFHASIDLSTDYFSWLPDTFPARVTARVEDNRKTGQDFSLFVDNVQTFLKRGALPVAQCLNLVEIGTEKLSAKVTNDFDGCIIEASATFYKSLNCTGTGITPDPKCEPPNTEGCWSDPDPNLVYKSGTRGGCAEAVEVTTGSPACVTLTLKSGRNTKVCY